MGHPLEQYSYRPPTCICGAPVAMQAEHDNVRHVIRFRAWCDHENARGRYKRSEATSTMSEQQIISDINGRRPLAPFGDRVIGMREIVGVPLERGEPEKVSAGWIRVGDLFSLEIGDPNDPNVLVGICLALVLGCVEKQVPDGATREFRISYRILQTPTPPSSVTWEYGKFELTAERMVLRIATQHHHKGDPDTWAREAISKESV